MSLRFLQIIVLITAGLTLAVAGIAQSKEKKPDSTSAESPLQGMTEAVLVDGQPALRIITRKNGAAEILYQKRNGEDAIVFPVMHWHAVLYAQSSGEMGKLYVTKNRLIYDPTGNKDHYFNVSRLEVKKAEGQKSGRFGKNIGHHILIDAQGDSKRFAIVFDGRAVVGFQGDYMKPATEFFARTFANFEAALLEFQQLTATVRAQPMAEAEETIEDEPGEITDKYDRFKDVTIVGTSRMAVHGEKRSVRIRAEYSFNGKSPTQPERVFLYVHASSARPLFRDDDLDLNFLIDGQRVPAGPMRIADEEKTQSTIRQVIMISLPFDTFKRIANARSVEFQIGSLEYKFTSDHLEVFKKLLSWTPEKTSSVKYSEASNCLD